MKVKFTQWGMVVALLLGSLLNAQIGIGINTNEPKGTLDIAYDQQLSANKPQTVSFPNVSTVQREAWDTNELKEGMLIYNTTQKCIEIFQGIKNGAAQWNCISGTNNDQPPVTASPVAVSNEGFEGKYSDKVPMNTTNKVKFKLQNNAVSAVNNIDLSNAVTIQNGAGTVQVEPGQYTDVSLESGEEKILAYTLTGIPQTGTLKAIFNHTGWQVSQQSVKVVLGKAKVFDRINYTASFTHSSVQFQGVINNTDHKVSIKIPYVNGEGGYNAVTSTQITAPGQGGDTNDLTLNIPAGDFDNSGELTATISVGGDGEYKVKQMPSGESYTIATFPIDMNGTQYNVTLKGSGVILDRCYDKTTQECIGYGANEKEHQFMYIPITGPDGKTWLNNNLGADYANINSPVFDPAQQANNYYDHRAYGSLFQWQRNPDGHELIDWSASDNGTPKYGNSTTLADSWENVGDNLFIYKESADSWVKNSVSNAGPYNLWQSNGATNPCPQGYHVPTRGDMESLVNVLKGNEYHGFYDILRFTFGHSRTTGVYMSASSGGPWTDWWSSSAKENEAGPDPYYLYKHHRSAPELYSYGSAEVGNIVRCIKD